MIQWEFWKKKCFSIRIPWASHGIPQDSHWQVHHAPINMDHQGMVGADLWISDGKKLAQLPHSYYFTTCILALKFVNKGVFFEEIQDLHFSRKRRYFGTHLHEFGEKGVIFMSSVLPQKMGFILEWKVSVLSRERGHFEPKSQCFAEKRGSFSNWRTRMGTIFSSEWGSQGNWLSECPTPIVRSLFKSSIYDAYHYNF